MSGTDPAFLYQPPAPDWWHHIPLGWAREEYHYPSRPPYAGRAQLAAASAALTDALTMRPGQYWSASGMLRGLCHDYGPKPASSRSVAGGGRETWIGLSV